MGMISNSTAIAEVFSRLDHKFDLITPREPSSIGTSVKVWKKENSLKPEKILPPSKRIMKKSVSIPPKEKPKRKKPVNCFYKHFILLIYDLWILKIILKINFEFYFHLSFIL